jgi:hypothetical protein
MLRVHRRRLKSPSAEARKLIARLLLGNRAGCLAQLVEHPLGLAERFSKSALRAARPTKR